MTGVQTCALPILAGFERSLQYDLQNTAYDYSWIMDIAIVDDAGVIAVDQYFTGKPSQDYNSDYVVTNG